jgi:hypothetical protein
MTQGTRRRHFRERGLTLWFACQSLTLRRKHLCDEYGVRRTTLVVQNMGPDPKLGSSPEIRLLPPMGGWWNRISEYWVRTAHNAHTHI